MSYSEFVPLGETSGLVDANGEVLQVYDNIMTALADQVRRITKNGNKLGVIAMTDLLRRVDTSIDTSDATAIAEYILKDYTAYVNGKKIVGTMPYIEGKTVVPSDTDIIAVPAGTYVMGDIIVKAAGSGGGGTDEPIEPDEPTDYDVITYDVETDRVLSFEFTFNAEAAKPYAYKVERKSGAGGSTSYITSVEGEFTHTGEFEGSATAEGWAYDAASERNIATAVSAAIDQADDENAVCRLTAVSVPFDRGIYTVTLFYSKGAIS